MKHILYYLPLLLVSPFITFNAFATDHYHKLHHHDLTPIGVMGAHTLHQGNWSVSYRYIDMKMEGNRESTNNINEQVIFNRGFMVAPVNMHTRMHMFSAMYGLSDKLTLMTAVPYINKQMAHLHQNGMKFDTGANGFGDVSASFAYKLGNWQHQTLLVGAALSFPTGDINRKDTTPSGVQQLPYSMQLGTGTYDIKPNITFIESFDNWAWGSQFRVTVHLGDNSNGYSFGDKIEFMSWIARQWRENVSTSLRLSFKDQKRIHGNDPELNPNMIPTANAEFTGGKQINLGAGINFYGQHHWLKNQKLAVEVDIPVYQSLNGIQLKTDWKLNLGWQYHF